MFSSSTHVTVLKIMIRLLLLAMAMVPGLLLKSTLPVGILGQKPIIDPARKAKEVQVSDYLHFCNNAVETYLSRGVYFCFSRNHF
mgnify:CR=1 FL=1